MAPGDIAADRPVDLRRIAAAFRPAASNDTAAQTPLIEKPSSLDRPDLYRQ